MFSNNSYPPTVKAWDPLVRVFHWSLVFFFLLAFATGDDWMNLHVWAGYAVAMLVAFRLLWGIIGTRTARFPTFVKSPRTAMRHLGDMMLGKAPHYLGHNPVAAMMIVTLLGSIGMAAFSGLVLIAAEGQGPLAGTIFASIDGEAMEEVHEFFADFTLLLVIAHVAGVVISSLLEGENLVKAMITGRKKARSGWADVDPKTEIGNES
jgi:cytochrome b